MSNEIRLVSEAGIRSYYSGYEGEFDPTQSKDLYKERIRKIIDTEVSNRIDMRPAPTVPMRGAPDLMEQILRRQ